MKLRRVTPAQSASSYFRDARDCAEYLSSVSPRIRRKQFQLALSQSNTNRTQSELMFSNHVLAGS